MEQTADTQPEVVASPCVQACRLDRSVGQCMGCNRTLEEIAAWGRSSNDQKRAVLAELPKRRANRP